MLPQHFHLLHTHQTIYNSGWPVFQLFKTSCFQVHEQFGNGSIDINLIQPHKSYKQNFYNVGCNLVCWLSSMSCIFMLSNEVSETQNVIFMKAKLKLYWMELSQYPSMIKFFWLFRDVCYFQENPWHFSHFS